MPSATKAMEDLVTHITTKYAGKKLGVFCSNDDIAGLFERQCIKKPITSVDQNISLMAQIAIQSLDNYIPYESMVPAALIEKETTSRSPL